MPGPAYCLLGLFGFGLVFFSGGFSYDELENQLSRSEKYQMKGRTFDQNVNSKYTSPQYLSLFINVNHSMLS